MLLGKWLRFDTVSPLLLLGYFFVGFSFSDNAVLGSFGQESLRTRGLRDDTTCLVVDLLPPVSYVPTLPSIVKKKQTNLKSILAKWRSKESPAVVASKPKSACFVEELFEAGSAKLAERFASVFSFFSS